MIVVGPFEDRCHEMVLLRFDGDWLVYFLLYTVGISLISTAKSTYFQSFEPVPVLWFRLFKREISGNIAITVEQLTRLSSFFLERRIFFQILNLTKMYAGWMRWASFDYYNRFSLPNFRIKTQVMSEDIACENWIGFILSKIHQKLFK